MIKIGKPQRLFSLLLYFILLTAVTPNEISNLLFSILIILCTIFGMWNMWFFKEFKRLKNENILLKERIEDCERRRIYEQG